MDLLSELKLRNKSINECSKETGIPYGALYPIIHKKVSLEKCEYATLAKLSSFFKCNIEDLFNSDENFSVYWENEKTADVFFNENKVQIKRYTTNPIKQIFPREEMLSFEVGEILTSRCWDKNRENIEKYLYKLGLTEFNPYKICRKTHGTMAQDKIWFKYGDENITWENVKWK